MTQPEFDVDNAQIGRILHFVDNSLICLPSIVIWSTPRSSVVKLKVFGQDGQDFIEDSVHTHHKVRFSNTWHWPRECEHLKNASR